MHVGSASSTTGSAPRLPVRTRAGSKANSPAVDRVSYTPPAFNLILHISMRPWMLNDPESYEVDPDHEKRVRRSKMSLGGMRARNVEWLYLFVWSTSLCSEEIVLRPALWALGYSHGMVFKVSSGSVLGRMAASPFGLICVVGSMKSR
jgi:hypothetical protein